jgi:hypothetical protein
MLRSLFKIFGGKRAGAAAPGGKEIMAEAASASPPAQSGGIGDEAIRAIVAKAVADAIGPIAATIGEIQKAQQAAQEAAGKAISAADVSKVVGEQIAAQNAARESSDARKAFVGEKLKDVPAVYAAKLGDDPAKWPADEQAIRTQYQADLAKAGVKAPNVDGAAGTAGAAKAGAAVDTSKISGQSLIEVGLKDSKPVGAAAAASQAADAKK